MVHIHFTMILAGFGPYEGDWNGFFEHMKAGKQLYGDPINWMVEWWESRGKGDILFVKYEDMIKDLAAEVRRLAAFLEVDICDALLEKILKDSMFDSMQSDPNTNYSFLPFLHQDISKFIRKGKIGDWKNYLTGAQNEWFNENYVSRLDKAGIEFTYEIEQVKKD